MNSIVSYSEPPEGAASVSPTWHSLLGELYAGRARMLSDERDVEGREAFVVQRLVDLSVWRARRFGFPPQYAAERFTAAEAQQAVRVVNEDDRRLEALRAEASGSSRRVVRFPVQAS